MDTRTGEIKQFEEGEEVSKDLIKVAYEQMTEKQKEEMQVSKYDNKSELGKIFTEERKKVKRKRLSRKKRKE